MNRITTRRKSGEEERDIEDLQRSVPLQKIDSYGINIGQDEGLAEFNASEMISLTSLRSIHNFVSN